jgi:hypothetical protein
MTPRIARTAQVGALVLALVLVPAALAAKGHGGGGNTTSTSSISAPVIVTDTGTPGLSYGDSVTFNISTTATTQPWVNLRCYQNGATVLNAWDGYFAGALNYNWNFGLGSGAWQSGAADCTAYLDMSNGRNGWTQLSSVSFHVDA